MKQATDPAAPTFNKASERQQYHRDLAEKQRQMLEDLKSKERRDRNGRGYDETTYTFRSTHGSGRTTQP